MTATSCDACQAALPEKPFKNAVGIFCSSSCAGFAIVQKSIEISQQSKTDKSSDKKNRRTPRGLVPILPEPTPFIPPAGLKVKPTKVPGMGRVEVIRNVYHIDEVTVLIKVTEETNTQMFGSMRNVVAYTDPKLGLLLRPNVGGVKETFADFPKAIITAKKSVYRRKHKDEVRSDAGSVGLGESSSKVRPERKVIAEASFGNLQEDPTSKRFWLIESMIQGGTAKEIIKRAANLSVKNGYFDTEDDYMDKMPSNYMAIKKMFDWWKVKLNQARIHHRIVEVDNKFNVEIVRR